MKRKRRSYPSRPPAYTGGRGLEILKIYLYHWVFTLPNNSEILEETWFKRNVCRKYQEWITSQILCLRRETLVQLHQKMIIAHSLVFLLFRTYPEGEFLLTFAQDTQDTRFTLMNLMSMTIKIEMFHPPHDYSEMVLQFILLQLRGEEFVSQCMGFSDVPVLLRIEREKFLNQPLDDPVTGIPCSYKVNP